MAASQTLYPSNTIMEKSMEHNLGYLTHPANKTTSHNVSSSAKFLGEINALLWNIAPPILLLFGTFGNVMTVVVMRGMRSSKSIACLSLYFTALAVSDQCVLTTCVVFFWVHMGFSWPPSLFRFDLLCLVPKFIWATSALASVWFLVSMTYQRVASVLAPHRVHLLCTVRRGKFIIATIVVLSCVLTEHLLYTWAYWPEHGQCQYRKKYMYLVEVFEWIELISASVIPFLLLASGNCVLIWKVIRSTQLSRQMRGSVHQQATSGADKVNSMTMTLILTSAVFLMLTLPLCVLDVCIQKYLTDDSDEDFVAMIKLGRSVADVVFLSSTATNFYLYLLSGSKFRNELKRYFCWNDTEQTKWTASVQSTSSKLA